MGDGVWTALALLLTRFAILASFLSAIYAVTAGMFIAGLVWCFTAALFWMASDFYRAAPHKDKA